MKEYFGVGKSSLNQYDFTNKPKSIADYINYMLCRTQSIFTYKNLPTTIPQRVLELNLQCKGHVGFIKHNNQIYALQGSLGGQPDENYQPTIYTIANPKLELSKAYNIDQDCVVMRNDSLYMGLIPLYSKYATQLNESDISMIIADINCRMETFISAQDDRTKQSAEIFLKNITNGKLGVIAEQAFLDGVKVQNKPSSSNSLTNLIEHHQYLKASWYNELGLNANYNMKRESINGNEADMNSDSLRPLIDNMLNERKDAIDKINEMFNLNIEVDLNPIWGYNQITSNKIEHNTKEVVDDEINRGISSK